jgi:hypothetical protein
MSQNRTEHNPNGKDHEMKPQSGGGKDKSKHKTEDQSAINYGQQRINYELVATANKLADVLEKLEKAIKTLPDGAKINFTEVNDAIKAARENADMVADIRPPGCEPS